MRTTRLANRCRRGRFPVWWSLILVVGLAWVRPGIAQIPLAGGESEVQAAGPDPAGATARLEARLAEARLLLAGWVQGGEAQAPAGIPLQQVGMRRALMERHVRLLEQHVANLAELSALNARTAEIARETRAWVRFEEPAPYSILLTDRLREETQSEQMRLKQAESSSAMMDALMEEHRQNLARAEEGIRQLNEKLEASAEAASRARLLWEREQEQVRSRVSAATLALFDVERSLDAERAKASRLRLELLLRQLVIAESSVRFSASDLEQATAPIERERATLEEELARVQARRGEALRAAQQLRPASQEPSSGPLGAPSGAALAVETAAVAEARLQAVDTTTRVLRLLLEGCSMEQTMWEQRFAAYGARHAEALRESRQRLSTTTRRLELWGQHEQRQLEVVASLIQLQQARLNALPAASELAPLIRDRLAALRESDQALLRFVRSIERLQRLGRRWDEGLQAAHAQLPLLARLGDLFADVRTLAQKLWAFELFTAEDTIVVDGQKITGKRSVTVGKVVMAVTILVCGIWLIGWVTRRVEPWILRRFAVKPNEAGLIRRWLRALLVGCLVVFSMASVKIPFTVFAFAGGALAIGLGFGTQTLLKNFVSGLILLFERPFRVGDLLDVGGQRGTITSIGLRASVLQIADGTEMLIPNSSLLEGNVTNWTYTDRKVRFVVSVGVAYGSDPRRVVELLAAVADRHGLVEREPKPQVLFVDFGESTLMFEMRVWVDVVKANAAQVTSDLRFMISGTLAEHGIAIDYPQRDVHLHAAKPLRVELVSPPAGRTIE